jgi:hypothetical protein
MLTLTTNRTPLGCWSDSAYRALASNYTSTPTMTAEECAKYCIGYTISYLHVYFLRELTEAVFG